MTAQSFLEVSEWFVYGIAVSHVAVVVVHLLFTTCVFVAQSWRGRSARLVLWTAWLIFWTVWLISMEVLIPILAVVMAARTGVYFSGGQTRDGLWHLGVTLILSAFVFAGGPYRPWKRLYLRLSSTNTKATGASA